jgi:hypothetical protein
MIDLYLTVAIINCQKAQWKDRDCQIDKKRQDPTMCVFYIINVQVYGL